MIPVRGYDGHRVAVLGLGRSGLATCRALRAGGAEPVAWDDGEAAREAALADGFAVTPFKRDAEWEGISALIVSPGVAHLYPTPHPVVVAALRRGAVLDNDVGLFFRSFGTAEWDEMERTPRVVCVTGSNGKSTTTALIHHALRDLGVPTQMGGNIGRGVLDLDPATDGEVVVLELSSYQLELARALAPDIAVFLNLSPDHLDRHGGLGGYFAAKRRLFTEGGPERAIIGVDEPEGRFLAQIMREDAAQGEPVIRLSTSDKLREGWSVTARRGHLAEWRRGRQVASFDLRPLPSLPGAHNHQNACAAYAVLRSLGHNPGRLEAAFARFPGLPHRCEILGSAAGVTWVNDSKATNADAAEKALLAFERVRWIAGGVPKEGGIDNLAPLFGRIAKAYLIGEAAASFAETLQDVAHEMSGTLEAAVRQAASEAEPGETILLSPACASFDQFASFEHRGDAFRALASAEFKTA
ncbi:MAG: UDP-N-acetylmuramoyl-L-alanine--D-glutamate ligase [Pseudomonadota bacterium]